MPLQQRVHMKKLNIYIIKSFLGPFVMTFFICMFVLLMQFLWKYLDELVGKGLENRIIIELMVYASINLITLAFPLAVLLASIMTFGNLGERFELLAIKASGVSLLKFMRPMIVFSILIGFVAFYLADQVIPVTNSKFAALLWSVKHQRPEMIIKEGVFSNEIDGYSIKVGRKDNKSNTLHDIMIYNHSGNKGNESVTLADSGYLNMSDDKQYVILTLFNGESYHEGKEDRQGTAKSHPFRRDKFKKQTVVIKVDYNFNRMDEKAFKDSAKMLKNKQITSAVDSLSQDYIRREESVTLNMSYNAQLNTVITNAFRHDSIKMPPQPVSEQKLIFDSIWASLDANNQKAALATCLNLVQNNQRIALQYESDLYNRLKWISRYEIEWHRKYTLSLACLIFFFIGAPLGAIIRKGGFGMPVVVSILMFISYYIVSMMGEKVAREGVISVGEAMWFSSLIYLPLGIFLTYQAVTDSIILNTDTYRKMLALGKFFTRLRYWPLNLKDHELFPDSDSNQ
jgi:lipopolysaccharide export system permease protein